MEKRGLNFNFIFFNRSRTQPGKHPENYFSFEMIWHESGSIRELPEGY